LLPKDIPDRILIKHYGLNRNKLEFVASLVKKELAPICKNNNALSLQQRVLGCLDLIRSGGFQHNVGATMGKRLMI
jgi:hypothetical protein